MAHSTTAATNELKVDSVEVIAPAKIRVVFTRAPLSSSSVGVSDALNLSNYTLLGPGHARLAAASTVPDKPAAIDFLLTEPLALGIWTLTLSSAIETWDKEALKAPLSKSFTVKAGLTGESVSAGAENDSAESILRKHFSPAFVGPVWNALLAALAVGDRHVWDNAQLALKQLYKSTASGLYLERLAADDGILKPADTGIPDHLFRQLAIKTTARKLTPEVILAILEVFYGVDAVRAHATSSVAESFALEDQDELHVKIDGKTEYKIVFTNDDFVTIGQAKAAEVAAAITRFFNSLGSKAYAIAYTEPTDNTQRVRIYSSALGLGSSVTILGGKAQNALRFPSEVTAAYIGTI